MLFWTFRLRPQFFGLPLVADRAVLVPTAEEDRALDLDVLQDFFRMPAGYLFLTPEEAELVEARAGGRCRRPRSSAWARCPRRRRPPRRLTAFGIDRDYVLYLGRVDRNKGCHTLLDYFQEFAADGGAPTLVLAGPATMRIPEHPRIRALGLRVRRSCATRCCASARPGRPSRTKA